MLYVLDSSALVDAWTKWYSPRVIPRFWGYLENLAQAGDATIPDAVLLELKPVDDGLYEWCRERESVICTLSTEQIQEIVKVISDGYPNLRNASLSGKNFADPVVIAVAEHFGCAVVTHEKATGNLNGPRIPDVCRDKGIKVMQVHHLVLEQGWTFH